MKSVCICICHVMCDFLSARIVKAALAEGACPPGCTLCSERLSLRGPGETGGRDSALQLNTRRQRPTATLGHAKKNYCFKVVVDPRLGSGRQRPKPKSEMKAQRLGTQRLKIHMGVKIIPRKFRKSIPPSPRRILTNKFWKGVCDPHGSIFGGVSF